MLARFFSVTAALVAALYREAKRLSELSRYQADLMRRFDGHKLLLRSYRGRVRDYARAAHGVDHGSDARLVPIPPSVQTLLGADQREVLLERKIGATAADHALTVHRVTGSLR